MFNFFFNNNITLILNILYASSFTWFGSAVITFIITYLMTFIIFSIFSHSNVFLFKKISLLLMLYGCTIFVYIYFIINDLSVIYYFFYKINNILGETILIEYSIGIDTISYMFLILTALLFPLCLMISWNTIYYQTFLTI